MFLKRCTQYLEYILLSDWLKIKLRSCHFLKELVQSFSKWLVYCCICMTMLIVQHLNKRLPHCLHLCFLLPLWQLYTAAERAHRTASWENTTGKMRSNSENIFINFKTRALQSSTNDDRNGCFLRWLKKRWTASIFDTVSITEVGSVVSENKVKYKVLPLF